MITIDQIRMKLNERLVDQFKKLAKEGMTERAADVIRGRVAEIKFLLSALDDRAPQEWTDPS